MNRLFTLVAHVVWCLSHSLYAQLVFQEPPENFSPKIEVAACFILVGNNVLFLKRQAHKSEGNTWGIPGGKLEKGESALDAVTREVEEETGLSFAQKSVIYLGPVFIRYPKVDFIYHMFETRLEKYPPSIEIDPTEHTEYRWMTLQTALNLELIPGEDECIYLVYEKDLNTSSSGAKH